MELRRRIWSLCREHRVAVDTERLFETQAAALLFKAKVNMRPGVRTAFSFLTH
jgi:hypothetical protein